MSGQSGPVWSTLTAEGDEPRPLYARVLCLQFVNPGGVLCFFFFEGSIAFAVLLALAELASWWAVVILPALVAVLVKANDLVAAAVVHSAAQVPEREQERFRRELEEPAVGRAVVPDHASSDPRSPFVSGRSI